MLRIRHQVFTLRLCCSIFIITKIQSKIQALYSNAHISRRHISNNKLTDSCVFLIFYSKIKWGKMQLCASLWALSMYVFCAKAALYQHG